MAMGKKRNTLAARAWRLLRLALLWARKGGALKRAFVLGLRLQIKTLRDGGHSKKIGYLEREFSFDETPLFDFKMHRPPSMRLPCIPCINPADNFLDDDDGAFFRRYQKSPFLESVAKEEPVVDDDGSENGDDGLNNEIFYDGGEEEEDHGIDSKAEEFIARFYEQMKLQRQVSLLQYNEMLQRGAR